jgi:hypothetical protein
MRSEKWLAAQKLLPQLSPQTKTLFNFEILASFLALSMRHRNL